MADFDEETMGGDNAVRQDAQDDGAGTFSTDFFLREDDAGESTFSPDEFLSEDGRAPERSDNPEGTWFSRDLSRATQSVLGLAGSAAARREQLEGTDRERFLPLREAAKTSGGKSAIYRGVNAIREAEAKGTFSPDADWGLLPDKSMERELVSLAQKQSAETGRPVSDILWDYAGDETLTAPEAKKFLGSEALGSVADFSSRVTHFAHGQGGRAAGGMEAQRKHDDFLREMDEAVRPGSRVSPEDVIAKYGEQGWGREYSRAMMSARELSRGEDGFDPDDPSTWQTQPRDIISAEGSGVDFRKLSADEWKRMKSARDAFTKMTPEWMQELAKAESGGFFEDISKATTENIGNTLAGYASRLLGPLGGLYAYESMRDQEMMGFMDEVEQMGVPEDMMGYFARYADEYAIGSGIVEYSEQMINVGKGAVKAVLGKIPGAERLAGAIGNGVKGVATSIVRRLAGGANAETAAKISKWVFGKTLDAWTEGKEENIQARLQNGYMAMALFDYCRDNGIDPVKMLEGKDIPLNKDGSADFRTFLKGFLAHDESIAEQERGGNLAAIGNEILRSAIGAPVGAVRSRSRVNRARSAASKSIDRVGGEGTAKNLDAQTAAEVADTADAILEGRAAKGDFDEAKLRERLALRRGDDAAKALDALVSEENAGKWAAESDRAGDGTWSGDLLAAEDEYAGRNALASENAFRRRRQAMERRANALGVDRRAARGMSSDALSSVLRMLNNSSSVEALARDGDPYGADPETIARTLDERYGKDASQAYLAAREKMHEKEDAARSAEPVQMDFATDADGNLAWTHPEGTAPGTRAIADRASGVQIVETPDGALSVVGTDGSVRDVDDAAVSEWLRVNNSAENGSLVPGMEGATPDPADSAGYAKWERARKMAAMEMARDAVRQRRIHEARRADKAAIAQNVVGRMAPGVDFHLVDNWDALRLSNPEVWDQVSGSAGFSQNAEAARLPDGSVVLSLDNIHSPSRLVTVVGHESGLHEGLRRLFGGEGGVDAFLKSLAGNPDFERWRAQTRGTGYAKRGESGEISENRAAAEEAYVYLMEEGHGAATTGDALVRWARERWRKNFNSDLPLNDSELSVVARDAFREAMKGSGAVDVARADAEAVEGADRFRRQEATWALDDRARGRRWAESVDLAARGEEMGDEYVEGVGIDQGVETMREGEEAVAERNRIREGRPRAPEPPAAPAPETPAETPAPSGEAPAQPAPSEAPTSPAPTPAPSEPPAQSGASGAESGAAPVSAFEKLIHDAEASAPESGGETRPITEGQSVVQKMAATAPIVETPVDGIEVDESVVPNFKHGAASGTGVVKPLTGRPMSLLGNPIVVYETADGRRVVVTGRHRLDLWKRNGMETIPARVIREADGWTRQEAHVIDAISNILDGNGTLRDYFDFFAETGWTSEEARDAGIPVDDSSKPGGQAWAIHAEASEDLKASIDWDGTMEDGLAPERAAIIAKYAPMSKGPAYETMQRQLLAAAKGPLARAGKAFFESAVRQSVREMERLAAASAQGSGPTQMDLFGDDLASQNIIANSAAVAKECQKRANEIRRTASILRTAIVKGGNLELTDAAVKSIGIKNRNDKAELQQAEQRLRAEADRWERGDLTPEERRDVDNAVGIALPGTVDVNGQARPAAQGVAQAKPGDEIKVTNAAPALTVVESGEDGPVAVTTPGGSTAKLPFFDTEESETTNGTDQDTETGRGDQKGASPTVEPRDGEQAPAPGVAPSPQRGGGRAPQPARVGEGQDVGRPQGSAQPQPGGPRQAGEDGEGGRAESGAAGAEALGDRGAPSGEPAGVAPKRPRIGGDKGLDLGGKGADAIRAALADRLKRGGGAMMSNPDVLGGVDVIARTYNSNAQVAIVDGRESPSLRNLSSGELRDYLFERFKGKTVRIASDGTIVEFTGTGLRSAMKKRGRHRDALPVLDNLVTNAHYHHYEDSDGQDKHAHLLGQFVYHSALRLADGVYRVEIKLDDPTGSRAKPFKGQTVQTKIADVALSASRVGDVEPASDGTTSATEGIPHGVLAADIPSSAAIIPSAVAEVNGESGAMFSSPEVRRGEERPFTQKELDAVRAYVRVAVDAGARDFETFAYTFANELPDLWPVCRAELRGAWNRVADENDELEDVPREKARATLSAIDAEFAAVAQGPETAKPESPAASKKTFAKRVMNAIGMDSRDGLISVTEDGRYGDGAVVAHYAPGSAEETARAAKDIRKAFPDAEVSSDDMSVVVVPAAAPVKSASTEESPASPAPSGEAPQPSRTVSDAADAVLALIDAGEKFDSKRLFQTVQEALGRSVADGTLGVDDITDILELAVNRKLLKMDSVKKALASGSADDALAALKDIREQILAVIPTQSTRGAEKDQMQQFSTPPNEAFAAAWLANIREGETAMEPSAGVGGIAVFARIATGRPVVLNELSPRRAEMLDALGVGGKAMNGDAEYLNALLDPRIKSGEVPRPTVVVMNPPFSNGTGGVKNTHIGATHVEEALKVLAPGGRLVAVVGQGMAHGRSAFVKWWDRIGRQYRVVADIGVNGREYAKYGTTYDNRILVIDKVAPEEGFRTAVYNVDSIDDIINGYSLVRASRPAAQEPQPAPQPAPAPEAPKPVKQEKPAAPAKPAKSAKPATPVAPAAPASPAPVAEPQPAPEESEVNEPGAEDREVGTGTFTDYVPTVASNPNCAPHPSKLVETAAMASIPMPKPTYRPVLTPAQLKNLSDAQFEQVVMALNAMEKTLPDGKTRGGYLIGDGTGVGKGREISGVIRELWNRGRKKAVWISKGWDLADDAYRDLTPFELEDKLFSTENLTGQTFSGAQGVAFCAYSGLIGGVADIARDGTLQRANDRKTGSPGADMTRIERLVQWLGHDFDGVIALDEVHLASNEESKTAKVVSWLQRQLPNARVLYVSATGATELRNFTFADRLGEWGDFDGAHFPSFDAFVAAVSNGGMTALEIVARDLKASGRYLARSLSFEGTENEVLTHEITPAQKRQYAKIAAAWRNVILRIQEENLRIGTGKFTASKNSQMYGAQQRFFSTLMSMMEMPTILKRAREAMAQGYAPVFQIVQTGEADQNRALDDARRSGAELDDIDLSPKELLLDLIDRNYPVGVYRQERDAAGKLQWVQVPGLVDPERVARRDAIKDEIGSMELGSSPLDAIIEEFGADRVAELTGRQERLVRRRNADGEMETVREKRPKKKVVLGQKAKDDATDVRTKELNEFLAGKRDVVVFSKAAGTGKSFHAGRDFKNQRRRIHFAIHAGWSAADLMQLLGRTHRSNEVSAPLYVLCTTNLASQKRFTMSVARRLGQLGSLTNGEREASGSGVLDMGDNLETPESNAALADLLETLIGKPVDFVGGDFANIWGDGHEGSADLRIEDGIDDAFDALCFNLGYVGVVKDQTTGEPSLVTRIKFNKDGSVQPPKITQFMNRLALVDGNVQDRLFTLFMKYVELEQDRRVADGKADKGMQRIDAISVEEVRRDTINVDAQSGTSTELVQIDAKRNSRRVSVEDMESRRRVEDAPFMDARRRPMLGHPTGKTRTAEDGTIDRNWRLLTPAGGIAYQWESEMARKGYYRDRGEDGFREAWRSAYENIPAISVEREYYVAGALLPVWGRIGIDQPQVYRIPGKDGAPSYLGIKVPGDIVDRVCSAFGVNVDTRAASALNTPDDYWRAIYGGSTINLTPFMGYDMALRRTRFRGDVRVEVVGVEDNYAKQSLAGGGQVEMVRDGYRRRLFVYGTASNTEALGRFLDAHPAIGVDGKLFANRTDAQGEAMMSNPDVRDMDADDRAAAAQEGISDAVNAAVFSNPELRADPYAIGSAVMGYQEGDREPDTTLVNVRNARTGRMEKAVKFAGDRPAGYVPKRVGHAYKLMEQWPDGTLHALFAGTGNVFPTGEWMYAQGFPYSDKNIKGMNLRERYAWHLGYGVPSAPHLMSKTLENGYNSGGTDKGHPKGSRRVWVQVAFDASNDWNALADSTGGKGDLFGLIPFGGWYGFIEGNKSNWILSSAVKFEKVLSEDERRAILRDAGFSEEDAWRQRNDKAWRAAHPVEKAKTDKASDLRALRERIASSIEDNAESRGGEAAMFSNSGVYTGSAADYAQRVPVLDKDGNVTGYRIENGPSLKKIGTGEGNQVYGWGLYASNVRGVAESYAKNFRENGKWRHRDGRMLTTDEMIASGRARFAGWDGNSRKFEATEEGWTAPSPSKEHLYEQTFFTDRADGEETERHLLKWYEPVSEEQLDWIFDQATKEGLSVDTDKGGRRYVKGQVLEYWDDGRDAYHGLETILGSPRAASEFLARAGIDGIKYPVDSFGGKTVKNGDKVGWNYVSFRDDNIRVDHKWVDGQAMFSNPDARRVTPEEDAAYMDAVKRGDMETAQRMVREAAARAMPNILKGKDGLPLTVWHSTNAKFNVFQRQKSKWNGESGLHWFSEEKNYSSQYGNNARQFFLNIKNIADIGDIDRIATSDALYSLQDSTGIDLWKELGIDVDSSEYEDENDSVASITWNADFADALARHSIDGVSALEGSRVEIRAGGKKVSDDSVHRTYGVLSPSQIKSADPVTYDDAGNVIPLSQRFNRQKEDVRFSNPEVRQGEFPLDDARREREDPDAPRLATTREAFGGGDNPLVRTTQRYEERLREALDMPEIVRTRETNREQYDRAVAILAADPRAGDGLVARINAGGYNPTATDRILLDIEQAIRENEYADAREDYQNALAGEGEFTRSEIGDLGAALDTAELQLEAVSRAGHAAGSAWGRAGQAAQVALRNDTSLAGIMRAFVKANGGNELTEAQVRRAEELREAIEEAERKLHAKDMEIAALRDALEFKAMVRRAGLSGTRTSRITNPEKRIRRAMKRYGAWLGLNPRPSETEALKEWNRVRANFFALLAQCHIAAGFRGNAEALVRAIQADFENAGYEAPTDREITGGISRYDRDVTPLSQDERDKAWRDLRAQMLVLRQIDAMKNEGEVPRKLSPGQDPASKDLRDYRRERNEFLKRHGFDLAGGADRLKTAQASMRTRLDNRIEDLEAEIAQLEQGRLPAAPDRSPVPLTPELRARKSRADALRRERDELRRIVAECFEDESATEAERVRRQMEAAERMLRKAKLDAHKAGWGVEDEKSAAPDVPDEVKALRDEANAYRALARAIRAAGATGVNGAVLDEAVRRAEEEAERRRADAERIGFFDSADTRRRLGSEAEQARRVAAALRKVVADIRRADPANVEAMIDRRIESALRRAAEWERKVMDARRGIFAEVRPKRQLTFEEAAAAADIRLLQQEYEDLWDAAHEADVEERELQRYRRSLYRQIADANRALLEGVEAEGKNAAKHDPRFMDDATYKLYQEVRKAKSAVENERRRIEMERASWTVRNATRAANAVGFIRSIQSSWDVSYLGRQGQLGWLMHPVVSKGVIGAGLRAQFGGAFASDSWLNPDGSFRSIGDIWDHIRAKAGDAKSAEQYADETAEELRHRDNWKHYVESGLYLSAVKGMGQLGTGREEEFAFAPDKLPTALGRFVKRGMDASERGYTTYLNKLRADLFDNYVEAMRRMDGAPLTNEEYKEIARLCNLITGRGALLPESLSKTQGGRAAETVATALLWSPRNLASKFELPVTLIRQGLSPKSSARVRKMAAKELAKLLGMGLVWMWAGALAIRLFNGGDGDDDKERVDEMLAAYWNPLSSDFGKVRIGAARIDIWAGMSQAIVFSSRMITGRSRNQYGKTSDADRTQIAGRFLRTKLAPVPSYLWDIASGKDFENRPLRWNPDKEAGERGRIGHFGSMFAPLSVLDLAEAVGDLGLGTGALVGLMAMAGQGVQMYEADNYGAARKAYKGYKSAYEEARKAGDRDRMRRLVAEAPFLEQGAALDALCRRIDKIDKALRDGSVSRTSPRYAELEEQRAALRHRVLTLVVGLDDDDAEK